jgi:hypothetical protein
MDPRKISSRNADRVSLPALRHQQDRSAEGRRGLCPILRILQNTPGGDGGDMSLSILSVGAEVFQFIQGIESRYRIGGNGIMSPAFAAACFGELSIPQAASDGSVRAEQGRQHVAHDTVRDRIFVLLRTSGANGLIQDHLILLSFENLPMR